MVDEKMIAWAAGIYEGEGTTTRSTPIQVNQKDTWILYRLCGLFGGSVHPCNRWDKKTLYVWSLCGESGRKLLRLFIPYLSPWRVKQIEDNGALSIPNLKTHCKNRHERNKWNTYWSPNGSPVCKICRRMNKSYNRKYNRKIA